MEGQETADVQIKSRRADARFSFSQACNQKCDTSQESYKVKVIKAQHKVLSATPSNILAAAFMLLFFSISNRMRDHCRAPDIDLSSKEVEK